ncbi:MAG: LRR adjacent, partial [Methanobacterium sp.]|nr:LRR adjacent [Methanobacterium sp.]
LVAVQYTFENYTIVDFFNSNDTSNFDNYVGNIRFSTSNLTNLKKVYTEGSLGEYNGYRTWEGTDVNGPYIYILLSSADAPVKSLQMDFKSEYKQAYKEILSTLKIKKIPT